MNHFIERCSCGVVLNQCRCPGNKAETVSTLPCPHKPNPMTARERAEQLLTDLIQLVAIEGGYFSDTDKARSIATAALADAERRVWEEAAKTVERERYLGLPNIDATTRTVTVSYVHQWMQNKLTRIAATIRVQATQEEE